MRLPSGAQDGDLDHGMQPTEITSTGSKYSAVNSLAAMTSWPRWTSRSSFKASCAPARRFSSRSAYSCKNASGVGQRTPRATSGLEQRLAQLHFQLTNGLAYGRLGAVHLLGCARKAAFPRNCKKNLKFRQIHDDRILKRNLRSHYGQDQL